MPGRSLAFRVQHRTVIWAPFSSLSLSFPSVKWGWSLTGLCEDWMRSCLCTADPRVLHTVGAHQSALLAQSGRGTQSRHLLGEAFVTTGAVVIHVLSKWTDELRAVQSPRATPALYPPSWQPSPHPHSTHLAHWLLLNSHIVTLLEF